MAKLTAREYKFYQRNACLNKAEKYLEPLALPFLYIIPHCQDFFYNNYDYFLTIMMIYIEIHAFIS